MSKIAHLSLSPMSGPKCRQERNVPKGRHIGTVLANPAGEPANRQRLSPMTSRLRTSPSDGLRLGMGFGAREGQAYGGDGGGEEHRDA